MPALSDIGLRLPAAYARALKLSLFFCDQHVRCATDVHGRGTNNLKIPMSIFRQNEFRKLLADYFRVNRDIFQRIQCWCLDKYFWCRTGEWLLHHVDHASARARRQSPKVLERSGKRQFNILINFAVIGISAISLSAQTKIESCGLSGHECHCVERTDAIHSKIVARCNTQASRDYYKDRDVCLREKLKTASHCDIAERWSEWDEEADQAYDDEGRLTTASKMGRMCTMACKKHDCKCNDGPTCHFGHDASEHKGKS